MAKQEIQNGQAEYGVVHADEERMRAAQQGVFEPKSGEVGMTKAEQRETRKAAEASPQTKMESATANKAADSKIISAKGVTTKAANNPAAKKRAK